MSQKIQKLLENQGGNYIFTFFWQHGESEEILRKYMQVIHESHIGAVCVESRPHPDFCGEKWWADMDIILDEARKRGMKVWVLDDSHFPTGYANGAMKDQPDTLRRQSITCRIQEHAGGSQLHLSARQLLHPDPYEKSMVEKHILPGELPHFDDDSLFSLTAVKDGDFDTAIDLRPYIQNEALTWDAPEGTWKIYTLHRSRNFGPHREYINMTDRASCRVLIDTVYEAHYAHYKEDFGKTIAGFFSDEPELGNGHLYDIDDAFGSMLDYPWGRELEEQLGLKLGNSFKQLLPLLWESSGDQVQTAKIRYTYMDTLTELVKKNFSCQLGDWCRAHGVQYIGHLIEDDNHHSRTQSSLGHYFRGLYGQDMAGIDDIGGQVLPQGEELNYNEGIFQHRNGSFYHYLLGKLGSSAAAVEPGKHGNCMCEIFGNYGWAEGVHLEKYLADHFMVRGVNHFVPHAFSALEFPDPDCPPHFYAHGHNPQYRHFGALMSYMNRVCELISGGIHVAKAAVLYHGEGDWTGSTMTDDVIGHILYDHQIDYDIIPQDVFADREAYRLCIGEGSLTVNTQSYQVLLIPQMMFITKALAKAIVELKAAGVPVLFIDGMPSGICDTPVHHKSFSDSRGFSSQKATPEDDPDTERDLLDKARSASQIISLQDLPREMKKAGAIDVSIFPADDRVRILHYLHDDGTEIFFLINEGTKKYTGSLSLPVTEKVLYCYDPWRNTVYPYDEKLEIEPRKSIILVADLEIPGSLGQSVDKLSTGTGRSFLDPWRRSICHSVDYPAFGEKKEVSLPDRLEEEQPLFSGFVRYENRFEARAGERLLAEISDASEGVELFLNGKSLGIQIVPTYRYDLTGSLVDGINELRIEVATTLEREMSTIPDFTGNVREATSKSGITGTVQLLEIKN